MKLLFLVQLSATALTSTEVTALLFDLYLYNFMNVLLLDYDIEENRLWIYSYDFYPNFEMHNITNNKTFKFDLKLKDLHGYQMKLIQYNDFPQSIYKNGTIKGLDGYYLKMVMEYFNTTAHIITVDNLDHDHTEFVEEQMETRNIAEWNPNFSMFRNINNISSVYSPYIENACILLPSNREFIPGFEKMLLTQFRRPKMSILMLFVAILWYIISRNGKYAVKKSFATTFDYCLRGLLSTSIPLRNPKKIDKFFIASILGLSVILLNVVTSKLISEITQPSPFESKVTTLAELNESNYEIGCDHFPTRAQQFFNTNYKIRFFASNVQPWHLRSYNKSIGFLLAKKKANMFINSRMNFDNEGMEYYYMVQEIVYITTASYRILKSIPYRQEMDLLTIRVLEAGLESYWNLQLNEDFKHFEEMADQNEITIDPIADQHMIHFEDLRLVFLMVLVGGFSGFVVCCMEVFYGNVVRGRLDVERLLCKWFKYFKMRNYQKRKQLMRRGRRQMRN